MILATTLFGCKEEPQVAETARPVRVYKVNGETNTVLRTFPGKVKATREASLAFRVSGQIIRFDVKEGDNVQKGQLIALLDQRDYQAAIADLEAKLAGAQSLLNEARLNIERNRQLLQEKIIAQSAFDTVQSTFESRRAEVLSLEQSLRRARLNLQYTRLEAPFNGTIAIKQVDNHEYVQAKEAIVQLEDISSLDIVMDVPENIWVHAFNSGNASMKKAFAAFETFPGRRFPLRLKEFQTKANPGTQTYEVTMTMSDSEGLSINPGMTAEVIGSMTDSNATQTLNIPVSAVAGSPEGEKYVWVLSDQGTVAKRTVEIGRIMNDMFLVHSGINPGETIVSAGVNYLREGQHVKILKGRIGGRE